MGSIFDKIGEFAKTAADKTNDLIEQTKLNSRISAEETAIAKFKEQIGNYYFDQFEAGKPAEGPTAEWYDGIKTAQSRIQEVNAEIEAMKAAQEPKAKEAAAPAPEPPKGEQVTTTAALICPTCGAENSLSAKFCATCGAKL